MLLRTAKSCGPDTPTLVSSSRKASQPYRAWTSHIFRKRRWQKSPVTGESTKETVKTIACGNAPRPLGAKDSCTTRTHRAAGPRSRICNWDNVIASEANPFFIVALWIARNDGLEPSCFGCLKIESVHVRTRVTSPQAGDGVPGEISRAGTRPSPRRWPPSRRPGCTP